MRYGSVLIGAKSLLISALLAPTGVLAQGASPPADVPLRWNPAAWSAQPTDCDRLAAHPSDPDRISPGVTQAAILATGIEAAIAACRTAVAADPANPRLNYQLARVLSYAGRGDEAQAARDAAVAGDYPQALFVVGYVYLTGFGAPRDPCRAAPLLRRSALAGRFAGLVGYPAYVISDAFAACPDIRADKVELAGFLARARAHEEARDYFKGLLIDSLARELASWQTSNPDAAPPERSGTQRP